MAVPVTCRRCGHRLNAPPTLLGKETRCLACGAAFVCEPDAVSDRPAARPAAPLPADPSDPPPFARERRPAVRRASPGVGWALAVSGGVALVAASVVGAAAYYLVSNVVKSILTPTPTAAPTPVWAPFAPPGEGYVVQMPGAPNTVNLTTNGVAITSHVLDLQSSHNSFTVSYADYQAGMVTPALLSKMAAAGRDAVIVSLKGKVIGERVCTLNGRAANEYQVQGPGDAVLIQRWCVARVGAVDRVYILSAQGPNYSPDSGDAARFFESFTVDPPPAPPEPPTRQQVPARTPLAEARPPLQVLEESGPVEPFVCCAVDPGRKAAFFCGPTASLRVASYPDFKDKGTYPLGGKAYHAAFDARAGRLYLAIANPRKPRPATFDYPSVLARRAPAAADIHVYDVRGAADGAEGPGAGPAPLWVLPLAARVESLQLSPDGKWLYYLDVTDPEKPKAGRLDAATGEKAPEIPLPPYTESLRLSPDGKGLYAAASPRGHQYYTKEPLRGLFQVLDPAGWKVEKSFDIDADPFDVAPTDGGLVYVSGGSNQRTDLTVVDARAGSAVAQWPGVFMRQSLRLSPDGKRLYLSNISTSPKILTVVEILGRPEEGGKELQEVRDVLGDCDSYPTPDGRFVLTRAGRVYKVVR